MFEFLQFLRIEARDVKISFYKVLTAWGIIFYHYVFNSFMFFTVYLYIVLYYIILFYIFEICLTKTTSYRNFLTYIICWHILFFSLFIHAITHIYIYIFFFHKFEPYISHFKIYIYISATSIYFSEDETYAEITFR